MYLACPCAPAEVRGGWAAVGESFADRMVDTVEARAPGFRDSVRDRVVRTPEDMAAELAWPGAHPMHLDVGLDQLGPLRPTRALAGHPPCPACSSAARAPPRSGASPGPLVATPPGRCCAPSPGPGAAAADGTASGRASAVAGVAGGMTRTPTAAAVPPTYLDVNRLWVDSRLRAAVALRIEGRVLERLGARGARCVEIGTGRRALGARLALTRLGATEVRAYDLWPETVARAREAPRPTWATGCTCRSATRPACRWRRRAWTSSWTCTRCTTSRTGAAAVRECARMLRPGGQLALAEMTKRFVDAPWLRAVSRHPADRFDADELLAELRAAGFEVRPQDVVRRAGDRWVAAVARRA